MRVLVTGGAGYIGSHMVHALCERGDSVFVVDDLSTGLRQLLPAATEVHLLDVGDTAHLSALMRQNQIQAVFHFAGSVVVPESFTFPLKYYNNNTVKTKNLIEACIDADVAIMVYSSSAAVYGNQSGAPIHEGAGYAPASPYGASKMMSEILLQDVAVAHGLQLGILRYFNVAGADPEGRTGQSSPQATHLIKVLCEAAVGRRSGIDLYGTDYPTLDGTCVRDYIHVTDLIEAHILALDWLAEEKRALVMNCGYGHGYSVRQVIDAVRRVSGVDVPVQEVARRAGDPASLVADATLCRDLLGWQPRYENLHVIVEHALQWEHTLARHSRLMQLRRSRL